MKNWLLVTLALLVVQLAHAQNCNNSQFKGLYSALAHGEFLNLPLPPFLLGPTTRIGHVAPDGKGNARIRATTSLNGFVIDEEYGGTYVVHPDCTTEVILLIPFPGAPDPLPFYFRGVISDNFQQHDLLLVNPPGSTVGLTLRQQNETNCSVNDLRGGWEVNMRGFAGLPTTPAAFARLGRIVFNGAGSFEAKTFTTTAGIVAPDNFNGTYTVETSCEFKMFYAAGTWGGVLMDNSSGAHIMVTAPSAPPVGAVISGILKKQ